MLIQYDYEIISYIANYSTIMVNKNLKVSLNKLKDELGNDVNKYLKRLEENMIVTYSNNSMIINIDVWIKLFVNEINAIFTRNDMNVQCIYNKKDFKIEFTVNGARKEFGIITSRSNNETNINNIYMCTPNMYYNNIYWLDLINDINSLYLFYEYLKNEADYINKNVFKKIDNLAGLSDSIVSEIFNTSIKRYFENKGKIISDLNNEQSIFLYKLFYNKAISFYGVELDNKLLCVVKNENNILFLELKQKSLYFSEAVKKETMELSNRLDKKISEYRQLVMVKENNIIDNTIKATTKVTTLFSPITVIVSLLGFLNINIKQITEYKCIVILLIIVLLIIQVIMIKIVYVPIYKISKFKWDSI